MHLQYYMKVSSKKKVQIANILPKSPIWLFFTTGNLDEQFNKRNFLGTFGQLHTHDSVTYMSYLGTRVTMGTLWVCPIKSENCNCQMVSNHKSRRKPPMNHKNWNNFGVHAFTELQQTYLNLGS